MEERAGQIGLRSMTIDIASRMGMDYESVERHIRRMFVGEFSTIGLYKADAYAIAIGQSPQAIWRDAWDEANPIEPYERYGDEDYL